MIMTHGEMNIKKNKQKCIHLPVFLLKMRYFLQLPTKLLALFATEDKICGIVYRPLNGRTAGSVEHVRGVFFRLFLAHSTECMYAETLANLAKPQKPKLHKYDTLYVK